MLKYLKALFAPNMDDTSDKLKEHANYCVRLAKDGVQPDAAIGRLKDKGATITDSIAALSAGYNIALREAKQLVAASPEWKSVAEAARPLHEEAIQALEEDE